MQASFDTLSKVRHILIILILLTPLSAWCNTLQGKVVKVADGDTVTIVDEKGDKHRIRLGGIDAPEKDQPYGSESTKNLEWLVYGKGVTIEYDKHDRYGRIVGKVLVNPQGDVFCLAIGCVRKVDAGLEQIKSGLAWHYKKYQKEQSKQDRKLYSKAERNARRKPVGLWVGKERMPPWQWRRK
ncbi:MAG: nuclease [Nitrospinae bacterium]|nr:nuclease [Nitrospinota bacterium]